MTSPKVFTLITILLISLSPVIAGPSATIDTVPQVGTDYYPWVTFLSQGPITWKTQDISREDEGFAYRAAITTAEIYNGLYIEKVTLGSEGCCKRITSVRKLDRQMFGEAFNLRGEFTGLTFIEWRSTTSFEFSIHNRRFLITDIDKSQVQIIELSR